MLVLRFAWRNVWRNPRRTAVVVTAVAVGIAGCALSIAINYGMVVQMVENAIATELGHLQIHASGFDENPELRVRLVDGGRGAASALRARPGVRAFARRVRGEGLVTSPRASAGVRVVGIEPAAEAEVSLIARSITAGRYLDGERRRVLVGEELADRLQVDVGDKVVLSVQDLGGDLTGEALRVAGLFRTPSSEIDRGTIYLRIDESQKLLGLDEAISEVAVVVADRRRLAALKDALARDLDGVEVRTWEELRPVLVYIVQSFDQQAAYVYVAVFIAMAFGIANVLLMAIYERTREIGVLMAIGMSRPRLVAMIIVESVLVTVFGVVVGLALTVASVAALGSGIDLSRWAQGLGALGVGTRIVPVMSARDFVTPSVVAVAIAVVASAWPALRAARIRPAEAVRRV